MMQWKPVKWEAEIYLIFHFFWISSVILQGWRSTFVDNINWLRIQWENPEPIFIPLLSELSESLKAQYSHIALDSDRNQQYSQFMGSNFNYRLCEINYYEEVDCAIIFSGNLLEPHCDVMNDWRRGYDFLSVTKTLIWVD